MAITDLAHTALACADLETSIAFYAQLGLNESFRLKRDDGSTMLVYLHVSGDRFIELFPGGPDASNRAGKESTSFRHICLMTDDIAADVERLRAADVTIDREVTIGRDSNKQAWIADPDGNPIELMQISTISPQRAVADGREPVVPDAETLASLR
ncbi:MAG: VOC family protein [Thermomicrobiales bacterium]